MNDQAWLARDAWRQATSGPAPENSGTTEALSRTLRDSEGGRNLIALGLEPDIEAAAQMDSLRVVPELKVPDWRIVAALP